MQQHLNLWPPASAHGISPAGATNGGSLLCKRMSGDDFAAVLLAAVMMPFVADVGRLASGGDGSAVFSRCLAVSPPSWKDGPQSAGS